MKKIFTLFLTYFVIQISLSAQTWTGAVSSSWNNMGNWSTGVIPGAGSTVTINNAGVPNICTLDQDRSVSSLSISAGTLDLGGFILTTTSSTSCTGGAVQNGTIQAASFSALANTTFNGTITLTKTGGTNNDVAGGNTFNGATVIQNNGSARIRMANTNGDTFNSTVQFVNTTTSEIQIARSGTNSFAGSITIDNSSSGGISFGANGGTSTQTTGALLTNGFTNGALSISNFTQNSTTANGTFNPTSFTASSATLNGNFSVTTSSGTINITSSTFSATNTFNAATEITLTNANNFSTVSGSTSITRNGGSTNLTWTGGNTFGNVTFTNTDDNRIQLATTSGDTFTGTASFTSTNSGGFRIATSGTTTFASGVVINSSGSGAYIFGNSGGSTTLTTGGLTTSSGFTNGTLTLTNVTQSTATANSTTFAPSSFSATNSNFQGDFGVSIAGTGNISFTSSTFSATNSFTADDFSVASSSFSTVSGSTTFTKKGGGDSDSFNGGNTFGNVTFINQDDNRISFSNGDTFNGTATFTCSSSGTIRASFSGTTTFASDIYVNSTGTGGVSFGANGGTATQASGGMLTSGFTNGSLSISNFTQSTTAANGTFNPTSFATSNAVFNGDISVTTSTGSIAITSSSFTAACTMIAATDLTLTNANNFSTVSGNTILTKNAGAGVNWTGGNTFGNASGTVTITNNDNDNLNTSNSSGDTYNGAVTFTNTGAGAIRISRTGTNTFAQSITLNNNNTGGISFGSNGGTATQTTGGLLTSGFTNGSLAMDDFTQSATTANGTFNPTSFSATDVILNGDISVTTSTGSIAITSSSFTAACTMIAATDLTLTNANNFSTVSGNTILTKNAGAGVNWTGGNTFGNASGTVTITNNDNDNLNTSNSSGDTYNGAVTFTNTGAGAIRISRTGTNTFAQSITLNNNNTGGISFGSNGGTATQTTGGLLTSGFTNGSLVMDDFTQSATTANGTFNPTSFSATDVILNGDISVTTSSGDISINNCEFTANNVFDANQNFNISNGNNFSTVSGTTTITKNGGDGDLWDGGNTFGNVVIINNDDSELRMADNNVGDDFNGSATFTQNSSGLLRVGWDGNNTFSGDITTSGSASSISFAGGNGSVIIDGNGTQTISGTATPSIDRLTMSTTGGGSLTLSVPVNVNDDLTMTSGIINTDVTNILTITDESASANIGNADSYVNGAFQYVLSDNASARSTLNMPIGKGTDWRPVIVQVAHSQNTSYTYRGEVMNSSANALGWTLPSSIDTVSYYRYWNIERYLTSTMTSTPSTDLRTASGQAPIITLYFDTSDDVRDGDNLRIVKNTSTSATSWIDIGGTGAPVYSGGAQLSGSITSTSSPSSFNSFSTFTLGSGTSGFNPLPVTLVNFTAKIVKDKIQLDWITSSEYNNELFEVQFSEDGVNFNTIGQVKGNLTSQIRNDYQFMDSSPIIGTNYYRLKQVDVDGSFEYSTILSIVFDESNLNGVQIVLFPNPLLNKEDVSIEIKGIKPEHEVQVEWMDIAGRVYTTMSYKTNKSGGLKEKIPLPVQLAKGVYHVVIKDGQNSYTKRVVVQ
jgi:hypothetical protein